MDTGAWLEYFADGPNASFFAAPIEQTDERLVPSLTIYEVLILVKMGPGAFASTNFPPGSAVARDRRSRHRGSRDPGSRVDPSVRFVRTGHRPSPPGPETCSGPAPSGTCTLASTSAGAKTLMATYSGDANFNGSSGTAAHQVNKADTTTVITSNTPDPSAVGQPYTVSWSVTVNAPGTGTSGRTVTADDGNDNTCSGPRPTWVRRVRSTRSPARRV